MDSEKDETLREYSAIVLDLIAKKNPKLFAELIRSDDIMKYPGLMEAFKEDVDERVNQRVQNEKVRDIENVMVKLHYTADQAMDLLDVPQNDRAMYFGRLTPVK